MPQWYCRKRWARIKRPRETGKSWGLHTRERDANLDRGCEAGRDAGSEVSKSHAGAGDGNEVDGVMLRPRGLKPGANQISLIPSAQALHPKDKTCWELKATQKAKDLPKAEISVRSRRSAKADD